MTPYINIHTHNEYQETESVLFVKNILLHQVNIENIDAAKYYSAGWHPWFIKNNNFERIANVLHQYTAQKCVIAIGECGIDRAIDVPIQQQVEIFRLHIQFAVKLGKPLIIHSVRAYSDVLQVLNEEAFRGTLILHDFRGNWQQVEQFSKYDTYFSFGKSIFQGTKIQNLLKDLSLSRILFETDESDISIEKIYLRAAEIKKTPVDELKEQVMRNFNHIFGNELD